MKEIIVLGLSGTIGKQTLEILQNSNDKTLLGFSFYNNLDFAIDVLNKHKSVKYVCTKKQNIKILQQKFKNIIFFENLWELSSIKCYLVVVGVVGFSALKPALKAIENKNDIALANKECIVSGGKLLFEQIKKYQVNVFAMDSELNAIEQCLNGETKTKVKNIILTASGGPFLNKNMEELKNVSVGDVTNHPNWNMGKKISVDSANLCNKILEVIETSYYFDIEIEKIKIVIQPDSLVHSMVCFEDNSTIMQCSKPSMLLPISYCLNKNTRKYIKNYELFDFSKTFSLNFIEPNVKMFPILKVLKFFNKKNPHLFIAFNALNEYFNYLFLNNKISFLDISYNILKNIEKLEFQKIKNLDDIFNYHDKLIKQMEEIYGYEYDNNNN